MAVVEYTSPLPSAQNGMFAATWSGLTGEDTGAPMANSNLADKTVHVFGTIGAPITIEGSSDARAGSDDPAIVATASWIILKDSYGGELSFSEEGMAVISQAPLYIRPNCADGETDATVVIVANAS